MTKITKDDMLALLDETQLNLQSKTKKELIQVILKFYRLANNINMDLDNLANTYQQSLFDIESRFMS